VRTIDFGDDLVRYARQLYQSLRDADAEGADRIVAVLPPARGLGHAIRDRLEKAAAR
jgi:L-threonylcarbamoyladenylate synthase